MELGFITKAMHRYWWLILAFVVLGFVGGTVAESDTGPRYEATAFLLVSPSDDDTFVGASTDRYISGQLVVLGSSSLAETVAAAVDDDLTGAEVSRTATFAQLTGTDVIRVTAVAPSAERATEIANGYVDTYLAAIRAQLEEAQVPDIDRLDRALGSIEGDLDDVDADIAETLAPFLPAGPVTVDEARAIPTIDQLDPALATRRTVLLDQYSQLLETRNGLQFGAKRTVASQVVQRAVAPTAPTPAERSLVALAGPVVGFLLGVVGAVVLARLSPRVLDAEEVSTALGVPLAGGFPRDAALARVGHVSIEAMSDQVLHGVRPIAVQAESAGLAGKPLIVVVTGSMRHAATTTVAAAMAARYARGGSEVLLVDANAGHPELTYRYAPDSGGVPALLAGAGANGSRPDEAIVARTGIDGLRVLGIGADKPQLRRDDVVEIVHAAPAFASVVVFDAGPLMESASAVQLTQLADAIVLTVPIKRQLTRGLHVVARQLQARRGILLPVATEPRVATGRIRRRADAPIPPIPPISVGDPARSPETERTVEQSQPR